MKILWVNSRKLLPLDTGGKLRSYHILRHLAARHEVTLLSYYGGRRDEAYEHEIGRQLPGAVAICTAAPDERLLERIVDYVRKLPRAAPYSVSKFASPEVRDLLAAWISERRFEVAVCDFLCASFDFPEVLKTPTVLFQHNVETTLWRRQASWEPNWFKKLAFKLEAAKLARYEALALNKFHHVVAVSEHDAEQMKLFIDSSRINVVPTGVDLSQYRRAADCVPTKPLVIFTGSMDWEANIEGVDYFCQDIWPHVLARVPDAGFRIVGRNPPPRIKKLASESIEVTGRVPSVIEHLREARVVVVPLRIGGGTRLKIYEAMAMGKAVVSTSIGAEGLDVHHGRDILLADDPLTFAEGVIQFLCDHMLRRQYETAAAELAAQYDWSTAAEKFAKVLERVVGFSTSAAPPAAIAHTSP